MSYPILQYPITRVILPLSPSGLWEQWRHSTITDPYISSLSCTCWGSCPLAPLPVNHSTYNITGSSHQDRGATRAL